mmetsp:Transcript_92341/g.214580  ORF Transcript_92341/g.214580 Transcript_92341/m.214580 type:complete len:845 (+) Transcript_92341:65-2599(+)
MGRRGSRECFHKTLLCTHYASGGRCRRGEQCTFAHGLADLRKKPNLLHTRLCRVFVTKGICPNAFCNFAHSREELRKLCNSMAVAGKCGKSRGKLQPNSDLSRASAPTDSCQQTSARGHVYNSEVTKSEESQSGSRDRNSDNCRFQMPEHNRVRTHDDLQQVRAPVPLAVLFDSLVPLPGGTRPVNALQAILARAETFDRQVSAPDMLQSALDAHLTEESSDEAFWACKHGPDMGNQGYIKDCVGPKSLLKPAAFWNYVGLYAPKPRFSDDSLYNSPCLDAQRNTYIASNFSDLFIIRPDGKIRGSIFVGPLTSTPVILGRTCYVVDGCGCAMSFDIETLQIGWRVKYCASNPWDSWSAAAVEGALIVGGNKDFRQNGATHVYRINTADGKVVWEYHVPREEEFIMPYNMIPGILNGKIVVADNKGYVYCIDFETGQELWRTDQGTPEALFSTATVVLGRNGIAANAWNFGPQQRSWNRNAGGGGLLDVYDLQTGAQKWRRRLNHDINVAPLIVPPESAVGSDGWQVIVCLGSNPGPPEDHQDPVNGDSWAGLMLACDAETGREIWAWAPPLSRHFTFRGSENGDWYLPDGWTSASADKNGTVYASFQDGVTYAVRGGELVSCFDMRCAANSAPAIGPGIVTQAAAFGLFIWRDPTVEEDWIASGDKRACGGQLPGGPIPPFEAGACGGPWDDGRLEWKPRPWVKTCASELDLADSERWRAECDRLQKEDVLRDLEWSEAMKAEIAKTIKASGGGKAAVAPERPAAKQGASWVVVGGGDKGGIVVRQGENLKSAELPRLATGATVEEIELKGDRLHYKRLTGEGPDFGWVSLSFKGTPLLRRED